jgi:hypothetical protein
MYLGIGTPSIDTFLHLFLKFITLNSHMYLSLFLTAFCSTDLFITITLLNFSKCYYEATELLNEIEGTIESIRLWNVRNQEAVKNRRSSF